MLFKVNDAGTNRKAVRDFLSVNNTNLYRRPISHYFLVTIQYWPNYCLWQGGASR